MAKRKATPAVAAASTKRNNVSSDQDAEDRTISAGHPNEIVSSPAKPPPSASLSQEKPPSRSHPRQESSQEEVTPKPPSLALQPKIQRLRAPQDDETRETQFKLCSKYPEHVVVSRTAVLGALMALYADWETGVSPENVDVEVLRGIVDEL